MYCLEMFLNLMENTLRRIYLTENQNELYVILTIDNNDNNQSIS